VDLAGLTAVAPGGLGYVAVFVGALVDATAVPFPGRLLLVAAGALAAAGHLALGPLWLAAAAGAVAGDHLWYLAGRLGARRLLGFYSRLSVASARCEMSAARYLERYGALAIVIGRFVASMRVLACPLAGSSGVAYSRFLACDVAGALLWAGVFVLLGYGLGEPAVRAAERWGVVPVAVAAGALGLAGVAAAGVHRLRRRRWHGPAAGRRPPSGVRPR
jgi:membrane protein DedA with SNARE-associated domain